MHSDDTKSPRSPQAKKALSYAKDRRNNYRANDKSSRKAIPARKAGENRKIRRKANQALIETQHADEERAAVIASSLKHDIDRIGGWTKTPDVPLREYIEWQAVHKSWREDSSGS